MKENLWINGQWALGDTVVVTALVRDIAHRYGQRFDIHLCTNWSPVWHHNPYVASFTSRTNGWEQLTPLPRRIKLAYLDGIRHAGRAGNEPARYDYCHFLAWFHRFFTQQTGLPLDVTHAAGDLHLTEKEKEPLVRGRYWVVLSGGKQDITCKYYPTPYWQRVVDLLYGLGIPCVQAGATHNDHHHPLLERTLNFVGRTDDARDLFSLIATAEGVLCGVTSTMHIAAALNKPCVVVAGGREEPWWEAYDGFEDYGHFQRCRSFPVRHRFLHTIGQLDCCPLKGCWRQRVVQLLPLTPTNRHNKKVCQYPETVSGQPIARCMRLIQPERIAEAVLAYYLDGTLPSI